MSQQQLFIPDRIKVGFQERRDTYTGKLAYVVYFDQKGVLRKESSWNSWRDHKVEPVEHTNGPTEGFVLNKGVGGVRQSYSWNARNEYVRVYDPRDFEFEISVPNLLFILRECDCSRGKGLEGKFVYAWDRTELVLLPVASTDYQDSVKYTSLQDKAVKAKDLIPGASYATKKQQVLTYLGRFDYHAVTGGYPKEPAVSRKYVFWDGKWFVYLKDLKSLAVLQSDTVAPDYADLVEQYQKGAHGSRPVRLFLKDQRRKKVKAGDRVYYFREEGAGIYVQYLAEHGYNQGSTITCVGSRCRVYLNGGGLHCEYLSGSAYPPGSPRRWNSTAGAKWVEPTGQDLWVELESGSRFRFGGPYEKLIERMEADGGEE